MGYLIWWMTILLVVGNCISESTEISDTLIVYRTPYETTWPPINYINKTGEYHRWGNAKGMLLKYGDGYIDSVEGMVPLNCAPATTSCDWDLIGGWTYAAVNISEDQRFTINIGEKIQIEGCAKDNWDCKYICRTEDGRPQCYCPDDTKVSWNTFCPGMDETWNIIRVPKLITSSHGSYSKWVIIPPNHSSITMTVSERYYGHSVELIVKERNGLQAEQLIYWSGSSYLRKTQINSNHVLEISNYGPLKLEINFTRSHLKLAEEYGSLNYEIRPVSDSICVSVIYTRPENVVSGNIKFNIIFGNGTKYEVPKYSERQFAEWKIRTFKSFQKVTNEKVNLQLDVTGEGTVLHSIFGCNPNGDRDVTVMGKPYSVPEPRQQKQKVKDASNKCFNGGVYSKEMDKCVCPEGFTGIGCDEGCGPYYFGNNCSSECSNFDTGCIGMIFCKKYLECLCAPGYKGKFCDEDCESGFYGSSCTQSCGYCNFGVCDRFTGYCHEGCQPGFRRPFCLIPYKYSRNSPTIMYQDINVTTIEVNTDDVEGIGESVYYQIQYKRSGEMFWTELQPQKLHEVTFTYNISDLLPGVEYYVRIVYIDRDGNSYQKTEVPTTTLTPLCTVPTSKDYNLTAITTSSSIELHWKYAINKTDCPVMGYTIILQRKMNKVEQIVSGDQEYFQFNRLLPGVQYQVRIEAITQFGEGPLSASLSVTTRDEAPLHISDLQVTEVYSRKLRLAWKPPRFTGGSLQEFIVKYQCLKLLACNESCENKVMETRVPGNKNDVVLEGLRPHTQYFLEVAAISEMPGPFTSIEATTHDSAPDAAPEVGKTPNVSSTNTTVSVQWIPLRSCSFLNGIFVGYGYILLSANETIIMTGKTTTTHITFNDLTPQSTYFVHIHAISTGGYNANKALIINASTAATVPDKVQNLVIYKRGRRMIGVRWAQPINTFGEIESYSLSYCQLNECRNAVTLRVPPVPCVPWPSLFCYSISNLLPNKEYSVSVRARNNLVDEYGEAVTLTSVTSEGVPEVPLSLRVAARTSDSITLEWEPPQMFNGLLRSYLINVEHIDSANSSHCCVYSPLQEIPVKIENNKYSYKVTDLMPASKYIIGVSAKTISLGPSAFLTLSTPPEMPEVIQSPKLSENNLVYVPIGKGFPGVNGTYLLLVLLPNGNSSSLIWNSELAEKLRNVIPTESFYVVEEYNAEVIDSSLGEEESESIEVKIGKGVAAHNGTIGVLEDPVLPSNFNVGLALILDYNGALSVGFAPADEMTVEESDLEVNVA